MITADVDFVAAHFGYDVLYYNGDGTFDTAPVVAWAVMRDESGFVRAVAITHDMAWDWEQDRVVCAPDGSVSLGETKWPTIGSWLEDVISSGAPPAPRPFEPSPVGGNVVVLAKMGKSFSNE